VLYRCLRTNSSSAEFVIAPPRNADHCEWIEGSDFRTPSIEFFKESNGPTASSAAGGSSQKNALGKSFSEFYATVLQYIVKWYRLESLPTKISWIMMSTPEIVYNGVQTLAQQVAPELAVKDDHFDEVTELNCPLKEIPPEIFCHISVERNSLDTATVKSLAQVKTLISLAGRCLLTSIVRFKGRACEEYK
jgi:hypothetical protein